MTTSPDQNTSEPAADLFARLQQELPSLGHREARAARYLLANFPLAGLTTVAEFAEQSGVSTATVLRLVKRLGFSVYAQFQGALKEHLETRLQSPLKRIETARGVEGDYLDRYFGQLADHMAAMRGTLDRAAFDAVATLLADGRRDVHVIGGRYSGHIADYFAELLVTVRPKVHPVAGQTQRWSQHLLDINRGSVLVVFDVRRYQADVVEFARLAALRGATVVVFTDPWLSPAARIARHVITFPVTSVSAFDIVSVGNAVAEALLGLVVQKCGVGGKERMVALEALREGRIHKTRKQKKGDDNE